MAIHLLLSTRMGERRLKISELSRMTGISRGTLTRMYNDDIDRVDLDVLTRLCGALQCDIADLLVFRPDAPKPNGSAAAHNVLGR